MSTTSCTRRTKCVTMGNPCNISELDFQPVFEVPNEPIIVINGLPDATVSQAINVLNTSNIKLHDDIDPYFGNWLEGRKVQKNSQDKTCLGTVEKYDKNKNWYRVGYQDGGSEDLKWKQLHEILVPLDISIPLTTLAAKMCVSGKSVVNGRKNNTNNSSKGKRKRSEPAQITHAQTENTNVQESKLAVVVKNDTPDNAITSDGGQSGAFVGRNVLKWSGNRHYFGEVKKYEKETKRYAVVYEDGKCEELEWHELENLLVPIKTCSQVTTVASHVDPKSNKRRKMTVNRVGGKKKKNGSNAMESGSIIESVDAVQAGSLIESIDAYSLVKNPIGCSNDLGDGAGEK